MFKGYQTLVWYLNSTRWVKEGLPVFLRITFCWKIAPIALKLVIDDLIFGRSEGLFYITSINGSTSIVCALSLFQNFGITLKGCTAIKNYSKTDVWLASAGDLWPYFKASYYMKTSVSFYLIPLFLWKGMKHYFYSLLLWGSGYFPIRSMCSL